MIDVVSEGVGARDVEVGISQELPDALPVLPLRETVPFPDTLTPLAIGQERSVALVNDVLAGNRMLVMLASRQPDLDEPSPAQLYDVGVVGVIARMLRVPDGTLRLLVQGAQRVRIDRWTGETPYLSAEISELPDVVEESPELTALMRNVQQTFSQIVEAVPYLPEELQVAVANVEDPNALSHLIGGSLRLPTEEKQSLLEETNVARRLRRLTEVLARELEVISIGTEIQSQVQSDMDRTQREFILRQQLKAIQEELGEFDESAAEANELREQLAQLPLPEDVRKQADRELGRLENLPPAAAEHGVIRTYLEWIASLPWGRSTEDNLDLEHARVVLDEDHYGLEQVKERILEFLAVRRLLGAGDSASRGTIISFVGPPGVGKTSLGKSIARALGREFERISAGGVRDEAEIRGHRRTYIGAMPGTIIRALRDAGSDNPLFMIDEIDKMGSDFRGDPASAMLEVLDPEQNQNFRDHYLDLAFDLSKVMFITTANTLDTIPGPLRDRMEIIEIAGYSNDEKLQIAKRYLVPRQADRNGLKRGQLRITDAALRAVIADYTREAGVRELERQIGAIARKVAREVAEGQQAQGLDRRGARPRAARPQALPLRDEAAHAGGGRRDRPRLDAGRRRRAVHRGAGLRGRGQAPDHGTARRRHEGVGGGGAVLRAGPPARARAGPAAGLVSHARHPHPRAGGRDPEGRAERGHHDGDGARVAAVRAPRARRGRDDRRDHAHRAGAADRRAEGQGARRAAQRDHDDHRARAQRARHRRDPRAPAQEAELPLRQRDRRGPRGRAGAGRGRCAGSATAPATVCDHRGPGICSG